MAKMDPTAEQRKRDHIDLAFKAQLEAQDMDHRFFYEPLLAAHPAKGESVIPSIEVAGRTMLFPLWVSSMTGGTAHASTINHNLAAACKSNGMGMGLGSCRILLDEEQYFPDFDVREVIGTQPLMANIGIAQLETMIDEGSEEKLDGLVERLQADGLIIHVNPLQEWFQPEGDRFLRRPIESIQHMLERSQYPIMVKEVGQGMGPESLKALLKLPLEALDFGAAGGTNFSLLEALRSDPERMKGMMPMARVGHTVYDMVDMLNPLLEELGEERKCKLAIVSGGVKNFLDGYYCMQKLKMPAIYAQASELLKRALEGVDEVNAYIDIQRSGLEMAYKFLTIKE